MRILNWFFSILDGNGWLGRAFHHYSINRKEADNIRYENSPTILSREAFFKVGELGNISVEKLTPQEVERGKAFGFEVSWGEFGYRSGGFMSQEEARKLSNFIHRILKKNHDKRKQV